MLAALANTVDGWRAVCKSFQATKMKSYLKLKRLQNANKKTT